MKSTFDGLVLVDKPTGPTSHDIVAAVRRAAGRRRVGHSGTLDPPASGLLIVALGRATRLLRFLPDTPKCYEGVIALGVRTDTDDLAGNVTESFDGRLPSLDAVRAACAEFTGRLMQAPPAVSARKVGGQRLYKLARRGLPAEAPPREVDVFRFELDAMPEPGRLRFRADVSGGTYIRSLARDLGARLGCGGALATLRRTAIGPFNVGEADAPPERSTQDWDPRSAIPLQEIPLVPPAWILGEEDSVRFVNGGKIPTNEEDVHAAGDGPEPVENGWVRVLGPENRLLGVGRIEDDLLAPRVVVAGDPDAR